MERLVIGCMSSVVSFTVCCGVHCVLCAPCACTVCLAGRSSGAAFWRQSSITLLISPLRVQGGVRPTTQYVDLCTITVALRPYPRRPWAVGHWTWRPWCPRDGLGGHGEGAQIHVRCRGVDASLHTTTEGMRSVILAGCLVLCHHTGLPVCKHRAALLDACIAQSALVYSAGCH